MPRLNYVTIRERDLGAGIDQQSAENQLLPGYCEDIENADPKSTGQIAKRTGYQGYAGYVPVRVKEVEYSGTTINFILDDSIQLPTGQSSPLVVLGKTSVASGDFASESIYYYSNFTADIRKTFLTGSNSVTLLQTEHDLTTEFLFTGVARSTSEVNNSNTQIFPDSISVNKTTKDITVNSVNNSSSSFKGFIYAKDKSAVSGTTYVQGGNTVNTGTNTFTILGSTHLLDNNNIIVHAFKDDGTSLISIIPDSVELNDSTGDIDITLINNASSFTAVFILTAAPTENFATGSVASGATQSIIIDTSGTNATDFAFVACYLETTIGGNDLEQILPDSIVSDAVAQTITVTFTNNKATGVNFEIYWDFATITTNKLSVTGTAAASFTDTEPQLTIWGLCHEEIYGNNPVAREGWVTHIDSYRASGENRLISGLGGNLFAARLRTEFTNSTDYLMPLYYPRLNGRLSADTIIGPAFYDTGESPGRTRGFITGDNGGTNFFEITDITYNSGTGYVDYLLSIPSMSINGTLSTPAITDIISTVTGLEDRFTAQQCGYSVHNGTFIIKSVSTPSATTLQISVQNSAVTDENYDETDVGGQGGVFTDLLTFTSTTPFLSGDKINSDLFTDSNQFTCVNSVGSTMLLNNVVDTSSLPGGLRIVGQRTSSVIPTRNLSNTSIVDNIVRGDMLTYSEISRQLRVKSVNQLTDISISITGNGIDTATVTLGSGSTVSLFVGKQLLITETSSYNGVITVTSILNSTQFTFASTLNTTEAGTLVGKTIQVDEQLTFQDTTDNSVSLAVHSRWVPVESPTDSFNLTPSTRINYFDSGSYENQNIIRSTMVQDNLYLTNYDDEVMKFDGTNIYRAGLFRWQPHLFVTTDTSPATGGVIVMGNPSVSFTNINGSQFTVAAGDELEVRVGDRIQADTNLEVYTVTATDSSGIVIVDRVITGATSGTITRIKTFKYYFRLSAVDANDNIIASAVTGAEDFVVQLGADAAVNIKLVGMPAWDIYDYDRLEVQIYRTQSDADLFFLLTTLVMSFNNTDGYIEYTDTDHDEDLLNLDTTVSRLKGEELGTAWEQPLRARYCTTSDNRLILGNLKDYDTLDIRILKNRGTLTQSIFTSADNKLWRFKKDSADTQTNTNMIDRANYEFVSTSSTVNSITGVLGTNFTVNVTSHGLTAGDWVYLFHSATADGNQLTYAGWWQVFSITDVNNFVVRSTNALSGAASNFPDKMAVASARTDIPVFIGTDGNYSMRNGNRETDEPYEFVAIRRLANAINTSMRKVDTGIGGYTQFTPWMVANAGNEYTVGQLVIKQPRVFSTVMSVTVPSLSGDFSVFVNNTEVAGSGEASAISRIYPSRIIISYPNFPEIFDNPTSPNDADSDSVIDINSADGQEITALIPFFGEAAFGSAQKSSIIVVFKTNSIYLVDLSAKISEQPAVQRLETRGIGCTAPFSVSVTRGGIIFANDTGIYRLGRNLTVEYLGRKYERKWKTGVNKSALNIATGHHDPEANSYKLSYPIIGETSNSEVAVYNHTREYESQTGQGSWTTYTNHPSTGWTSLEANSYFGSTTGRVFQVRRLGNVTDYRDDDQAIPMTIITRGMDMLESGIRKVYNKITTHYRGESTSTGTTLQAAVDLNTVFQDTDPFKINVSQNNTGLEDTGFKKIVTIASTFRERIGVYLQLKYQNSTLDEPVEITGIDIKVAAKSDAGVKEAAETE